MRFFLIMWWDGKILWDSGNRVKSKLESEINFSMRIVGLMDLRSFTILSSWAPENALMAR